ncbi:MAG TPA: hypothetical protein VHB73_04605 [Alphaproteobacteria bacterium]|nr:hypothetical protein [Alphaproteobacteria bacterium]
MAMRHCLWLFLLFVLFGGALHASDPSVAEFNSATQQAYNDAFLGKTRNELIGHYGAPSHSVKLDDNGIKILEYISKRQYIRGDGKRSVESCTLRFWLKDAHVVHIDDIGERVVCVHFVTTKERYYVKDMRDDYIPCCSSSSKRKK